MRRILIIAATVGIAATAANAGQVQIGGSTGLTLDYVTAGNNTSSSPSLGGGFAERNYDFKLFSNAAPTPTPTLSTGTYTKFNGEASGATLKDSTDYTGVGGPNGVTFSLISDGCNAFVRTCPGGTANNNLSNNFWVNGSLSGAPSTLTIAVGVFGVTDVWTMLNDVYGRPSAATDAPVSDTKVTFNFGTTATGGIVDVVEVALNNALAGVSTTSYGQIRSAVDCTVLGSSTCNSIASGPLAPTSTLNSVVNGSGSAPVTVLTKQLTSNSYTSANAPYAGSSGNVVLDSQGFLFGGAYSNLYLVNVQITNDLNNAASQTALSAITVDTKASIASTPEPASVLLLLSGVSLIGLARLRRRA